MTVTVNKTLTPNTNMADLQTLKGISFCNLCLMIVALILLFSWYNLIFFVIGFAACFYGIKANSKIEWVRNARGWYLAFTILCVINIGFSIWEYTQITPNCAEIYQTAESTQGYAQDEYCALLKVGYIVIIVILALLGISCGISTKIAHDNL